MELLPLIALIGLEWTGIFLTAANAHQVYYNPRVHLAKNLSFLYINTTNSAKQISLSDSFENLNFLWE